MEKNLKKKKERKKKGRLLVKDYPLLASQINFSRIVFILTQIY